jgi:tetratricopeptide (TPR) repeat protein
MELASLPLHEARAHLLARAAAPDQWLLKRTHSSGSISRPLRRALAENLPMAHKLHQAGDVRRSGRHLQALANFKALVTEMLEQPGHPMALLGEGHAGVAVTSQEMGLWEQARKCYMAAIDCFQVSGTHENADVLVTLYNNIAMTCRELGEQEEAELAYVTAIELHELHLSNEHMESLTALYGNLAYLYHSMGLSSEGYEVQKFAVSVKERTTPNDRLSIIQALRHAGVFASSGGRHDEAIRSYTTARQMLTSLDEPNPRLLCDLWISEAVSHHSTQHTDEALRLYQLAMDHVGSNSYRDDIMLATLQNNVGCIYMDQNELDHAVHTLNRAQTLLKLHPAADVGVRAEVMHNLHIAYQKLGNDTASAAYRDASMNLMEFVTTDVRRKLLSAEQAQAALPAGAGQIIKRQDTYIALPLSIVAQKQRVAQSMVIPLTTETITWA